MTAGTDKVPAKNAGDIEELKSEVAKLKEYLRKQHVWEQTVVMTSLDQLVQKGLLTTGPNVTDPPKPPRP